MLDLEMHRFINQDSSYIKSLNLIIKTCVYYNYRYLFVKH